MSRSVNCRSLLGEIYILACLALGVAALVHAVTP
jgi:hypothetical protein